MVNGERSIAVIEGDNVYVQKKSKFIPVPREKALSSLHDQSFWAYQDKKLLFIAIFIIKRRESTAKLELTCSSKPFIDFLSCVLFCDIVALKLNIP